MSWWRKQTDNEEPLLNKTFDETSGLLPAGEDNGRGPSSAWLYANFVTMSTMFSLTHGTVVSCLSYASAELGTDMGSYGSFTLMFVYAFAAILLSKPITSQLGGKWALFTGIVGYCLYVGGFLFAVIVSSGAPALLGSCILPRASLVAYREGCFGRRKVAISRKTPNYTVKLYKEK